MTRCLILPLVLALTAAPAAAYELFPLPDENSLSGLELQVDLVIGADPDGEVMLGSVSSVAVAPGGDIFLCDMQLNVVYRLDADGELVATLGQAGEGPGDLGVFSRIALGPDGRIRLASMGARVDILDEHWNVLGGFDRPNPGTSPRSLVFAPNGNLYISAGNTTGDTMIDRYDADRNPIASFCDAFHVGTDWQKLFAQSYAVGFLASDASDDLLYLQYAPYEIRRFDLEGKLLASTRAGAEHFVPEPRRPEPEGGRLQILMLWGGSGIERLPDGRIITSSWRKDRNDGERYETTSRLCLYDAGLNLLARSDFAGGLFLQGIGPDGRLYFYRHTPDERAVLRAALVAPD